MRAYKLTHLLHNVSSEVSWGHTVNTSIHSVSQVVQLARINTANAKVNIEQLYAAQAF